VDQNPPPKTRQPKIPPDKIPPPIKKSLAYRILQICQKAPKFGGGILSGAILAAGFWYWLNWIIFPNSQDGGLPSARDQLHFEGWPPAGEAGEFKQLKKISHEENHTK
jgi:hypothetical protein